MPGLVELLATKALVEPHALQDASAPMSARLNRRVIVALNGKVGCEPRRHVHRERLSDREPTRGDDAPAHRFRDPSPRQGLPVDWLYPRHPLRASIPPA